MSAPLSSVRGRALLSALILCFAAYLAWQVAGWGGAGHRTLIGDLAIIPFNVAATVAAGRAARRAAGAPRLRRSWTLVAAGLGCFTVGDGLQALYECVLHLPASPSWADPAYLAFYPLVLAGLLTFPTARPLEHSQRAAIAIDLAMVCASGATAVWYLLLGPGTFGATPGLDAKILAIAYPVADMLLVCALAHVLVRRAIPGARRPLVLLSAAVLLFVAADLAWGWLSVHSSYTGGDWLDILYTSAMVVFTVAGLCQGGGEEILAPSPETRERATGWLPHLAPLLLLGLIALAERHRDLYPDQVLIVVAAAVLVMSVLRSFLAQREVLAANRALAGAHAEIEALAATDELTGLPNHRAMVTALDLELTRAARYDRECAVLFIDVDHFKQLNDTLGHGAGDDVLAALAQRLRASVRAIDTVGRWGGEEFIAIVPEAGPVAAQATAERIRAAVGGAAFLRDRGPGAIRVTCSIGVAGFPADGVLREGLVDAADRAMYVAKRSGRDRAVRAGEPLTAP